VTKVFFNPISPYASKQPNVVLVLLLSMLHWILSGVIRAVSFCASISIHEVKQRR